MLPAEILRPLIDLAAKELPLLPPNEAAALYRALAEATKDKENAVSLAATTAADAIDRAQVAQLSFANLFKP